MHKLQCCQGKFCPSVGQDPAQHWFRLMDLDSLVDIMKDRVRPVHAVELLHILVWHQILRFFPSTSPTSPSNVQQILENNVHPLRGSMKAPV